MAFHPVLETLGGHLKIAGLGASAENQHAPHYSRYAFSWQGCATKVAPSFSPRSREIAVLRL